MNKDFRELSLASHLALVLSILFCVAFFPGCVTGADRPDANPAAGVSGGWIAPMLSLKLSGDTANLYTGTISAARANSAEGATPAVRVGQVTTPGITEALLMANGAIKATANLRYDGEDEFLVRFRLWVDEFSGHSIVRRLTNASGEASDRVLALWRDPEGTWWDLRRSALGGVNTGGIANPFPLGSGINANPVSIKLNRNTAPEYASVEFYIIVLDHAQANAETAGYVVTYYVEMPDRYAGHFHAYEMLVSTSTALAVNPAR